MSKLLISLLVLCFASIAYCQNETAFFDEYLHNKYIINLNNVTFDAELACSGKNFSKCTSFVVEFYSSNSEYSRNISKVYIEAESKTRNWNTNILKFAAVDCFQKANHAICARHGYKESLLFRYFPRNSSRNEASTITFAEDVDQFIENIVEKITDEYWIKGHDDWPNFNLLPHFSNVTDFWNGRESNNCTVNYLMVLVDSEYDGQGMKYQIESFYLHPKDLPIRRVNKDHELVTLLGKTDNFPELVMFKRPPTGANCSALSEDPKIDFSQIVHALGIEGETSQETSFLNGTLIAERKSNKQKGY